MKACLYLMQETFITAYQVQGHGVEDPYILYLDLIYVYLKIMYSVWLKEVIGLIK